jgi:hypothetical protein
MEILKIIELDCQSNGTQIIAAALSLLILHAQPKAHGINTMYETTYMVQLFCNSGTDKLDDAV